MTEWAASALLAGAMVWAAPVEAYDVNGCQEATLTDLTGQANVLITFGNFFYSQPCIRVSPGTNVTFSGSFGQHPLQGGTWDGTTQEPDPNSPIQFTISGNSVTFMLNQQGIFPYVCVSHFAVDMVGAIYVGQDLILSTDFE